MAFVYLEKVIRKLINLRDHCTYISTIKQGPLMVIRYIETLFKLKASLTLILTVIFYNPILEGGTKYLLVFFWWVVCVMKFGIL